MVSIILKKHNICYRNNIFGMQYLSPAKFSFPIRQEAVAAEWRNRGYTCELWVDPPGQKWLDYAHNTNELVTVVEGQLKIAINDQEIIINPGDELFIPKGVRHSVWNIHKGTSRWLYGYD